MQDAQLSIHQLEQQTDTLRAKAVELVEADTDIRAIYDLLVSVKGIGQVSALALLGELLLLPDDMTARQWLDRTHAITNQAVASTKKPG